MDEKEMPIANRAARARFGQHSVTSLSIKGSHFVSHSSRRPKRPQASWKTNTKPVQTVTPPPQPVHDYKDRSPPLRSPAPDEGGLDPEDVDEKHRETIQIGPLARAAPEAPQAPMEAKEPDGPAAERFGPALSFELKNVSLHLPASCLQGPKKLLDNVSAQFQSRQVVAIMGPSGSGKTTLLNLISGHGDKNLQHEGSIHVNRQVASPAQIRSFSSYVLQDDAHVPTMTPMESVYFSSVFRLPQTMSPTEKMVKTTQLLSELGLLGCKDTRIGDQATRGISGGERRRVSVACELIPEPRILFLDEPTSGLDSTTAYALVEQLQKLAVGQNRLVIMTIHSPSKRIWNLFDKVLLIAQGKLVYFGERALVIPYFEHECGYRCSASSNPSDYFLTLIQNSGPSRLNRFFGNYSRYEAKQQNNVVIPADDQKIPKGHVRDISWVRQTGHLFYRDVCHGLRMPWNIFIRFMQTTILALFLASVYPSVSTNQGSIAARLSICFFSMAMQSFMTVTTSALTFTDDKVIFLREKQSRMYSTSAYFVAKSMADILMQTLLPILFSLISTSVMSGILADNDQVQNWTICLILVCYASNSLGLIVAAVSSDPVITLTLTPIATIPFLVVSGFFINLSSIPVYLSWFKFLSPHFYAFQALMTLQFSDLQLTCDKSEMFKPGGGTVKSGFCPITDGNYVLSYFCIGSQSFAFNIGIIFLLTAVFRFIAFGVLRLRSRVK